MEKKYVYLFSEGDATMKNLLGGKGANLAEMTRLGFPVPQGFTVSTEACTKYYDDGQIINDEIQAQIYAALAKTEEIAGKNFGDVQNPFLVSVRSGARASMPGMMDTILNLGLNDEVVVGLANKTGNERFAYDSYRRFIQMFSDVVMELSKKKFEEIIDAMKNERGIKLDTEFTIDDLKEMVVKFKAFYKKEKGVDFPQDPKEQMLESIKAVFRSWDNPRANVYRRMNEIPYDWGTAVNVQAMVFGNMGETSGTGVAFTRDPSTGENVLYGEYLINAQGEDVVAGVRTPQHISKLEQDMPAVFKEFKEIAEKLEKHYRDMQDMEYTIEDGTLYMLQTRNGKRTAAAAIKVAVDLVEEGMITKEEAILQVDPKQLDALLHPTFVASALKSADVLTKGLAASPGAACGQVYFTADDCVEAVNDRGETVVLVRLETSPEDIEGMDAAQGVLTARGGMTSHAAVVARGMGTCCVAGCGDIKVDYDNGCFMVGSTKINKGDFISIDGSTGNVYIGKIDTESAKLTGDFEKFMSWADEIRTLKVRTNADTPKDAKQAREFGAEGIGLCRTEHMFFAEERIAAIREMIVSKTVEQRRAALDKLLPMQRGDFEGIFRAMDGLGVTIRLLDPPLHEFVPHKDEEIKALATEMGLDFNELKATVADLAEFNPMMGHRGCRLAVTYPEIAEMQSRAIMEAAVACNKDGMNVVPEIMIPLVGEVKELAFVKKHVVEAAEAVLAENNMKFDYKV
ncbi:MAG: pyruvate, phosphate dikinase, partial [Oscillospiraceae bacterium]